MLLVYLPQWRRNIQLFQRGKLQVIGRHSAEEVHAMIAPVVECLQPILPPPPPPLLHQQHQCQTPMRVNLRNLVICVQLTTSVKLHRFPHSAGCNGAFYEPELFPALQVNKWLPVHVAVFRSGKRIIFGLLTTSESALTDLLRKLLSFLDSYQLLTGNGEVNNSSD